MNRRDFVKLASSTAALVLTAPRSFAAGEQAATTPGNVASGISATAFEGATRRAAAMVSKMTLAEKISQFGRSEPAIQRIGLPKFSYNGSEALHGLIHNGPVTSFPLPLALGCSWNRDLVQRVFTAVSDEIWAWHKKSGMSLAMFSPPTVNMGTRDPRWGRIGENYGEDPYLVQQMAVAVIHGMQGDDPRYLKSVACAKHYIANDTEDDRHETSAEVDPRSFWEYYTRGFEACVRDGHIFAVMSSYNAMNGIPTTCSRYLLTELLRDRWGFRGYVVSDCDAVEDICDRHHFVPTYAEAAALAVNAGCDVDCGDTMRNYLGKAVKESLISQSAIDGALVRAFTVRILLGTYDPPEEVPYHTIPESCLESPDHRELALEAARQSIVLFKNDNHTLPLDKEKIRKIAIIGPMADICNLGNYSGTPLMRVSPLHGIREYLGIRTETDPYHRRAADFTELGGPQLSLGACEDGGECVGYSDGSWSAYDGMRFAGATRFHVRASSASHPGRITVHLDSIDGPVLCNLEVPVTGDGQEWSDVSSPIQPVAGEHRLFLLASTSDGINLQSFEVSPAPRFHPDTSASERVAYAMGCTVAGKKDPAEFAKAERIAREADVCLVFAGCDEQIDREHHDRSHIRLPGAQSELLKTIYEANPKTILVLSSNAPVAIIWAQEMLPAIIGGYFLGEQQGKALAEALFGDVNPGGKLNTTWYRGLEDLPEFHDYNIRHGRTYMYFKGKSIYPFGENPIYSFGHGLSYTTFQYSNLKVNQQALASGGKVVVSCSVKNTGERAGDEVAQLYVHVDGKPNGPVRPLKQLANFERLHLKAGETGSVNFSLSHDDQALQYWDVDRYQFVVEPGTLHLLIGSSSSDIRLKTTVQLT